jgi:2-polyprenyl-6-hydroxyphenyl methylase/3-demethylubiquinone-9 3-methyltransferase
MKTRTIDDAEIAHFAKDSADWWNPDGAFKPLHWMTPARMEFIRQAVLSHFKDHTNFKGLSVVDIGCGGGLACEPMARMGASVTGIDADATAIDVARHHAESQNLEINYIAGASEDLAADKKTFDIVLALEVIEHVRNPEEFVSLCSKLLKPGGLLIVSTLNRTWKSFAFGIVAAEHVLHWAPKGTHSWKKFIRPAELARMARSRNLKVTDISGIVFDPLLQDFVIRPSDVDINYFLVAKK